MSKKNRKKSPDRSADGHKGKNVPLPALKRRWAMYSAVIGLAALGALAILNAGGLMGEPAAKIVPDFSVDTADGKYVFSENRGKTLVYFFSFPG